MISAKPSFLVGLIGAGIQKSRTPLMHELEGDSQGLRVSYQLIDLDLLGLGPEALPDLIVSAERLGFAGLNVTYPCKQRVIPLLHDLSPDATLIGAVNTIVLQSGKRVGHNTDCAGFAGSFRLAMPQTPRTRVLLVGAGGAGSAVAVALLREGAQKLIVTDVSRAKADALVDTLCKGFGAGCARVSRDIEADAGTVDGIVNCTPVGSVGHAGLPLNPSLLRPRHWVADVVYFPIETELLAAARRLGCQTMSGAGMAVLQAVEAFRLFTGREPDAERMRRRFEEIGDLARASD